MRHVLRNVCLVLITLHSPLLAADRLYDSFQNPPADARPFVRWWWNGGRVTESEIRRELDVMKAAGIGGVEINTIGMLEAVTPEMLSGAAEPVQWLSPEWNRLINVTTEATRERGMTTDLLVGSGWPFGGRFLSPPDLTQRVRLIKKQVTGPAKFKTTLAALLSEGTRGSEEVTPAETSIQFLRLVPRPIPNSFNPGVDLMSSLTPEGSMSAEVPQGEFTVYCGVWERGFTHVKLGAPGADGPVVDHFNAVAVRKYLDHLSTSLGPVLGGKLGPAIRAMFIDSLELDHANWTTDLPEQFSSRRRYQLSPYLPFVLDMELGQGNSALDDTVRRARHDFAKTLVELFHERFLGTYTAWCLENGVKSRMQAYGRETHPLTGGMMVDLPEGESWLWGEGDRVVPSPTVANKYVSSAAHLSGKRRVSFEAMTNAVPVFRETLEDFKLCFDMSLMTGVNHPIVHGFNYSPPKAGFPGWVRFGSYLNEQNPWWPHFHRWSDYAARLTSILSQTEPQASVAILGPKADEWSRHFMLYQPFPEVALPWYHYHFWQALNQLGLSSDFVSEEVVQTANVKSGKLVYRSRTYNVIILQDVQSMEPATALALASYAKEGGRIVFIGAPPDRSSGLGPNQDRRDAVVQGLVRGLFDLQSKRILSIPSPQPGTELDKDFIRLGLSNENKRSLLEFAARLVQQLEEAGTTRDTRIDPPTPDLLHLHHRDGDRDIFLFSNSNRRQAVKATVSLPTGGKQAWRWDPSTGERTPFKEGSQGNYPLKLGPAESLLLIFEPGMANSPTEPPRANQTVAAKPVELAPEWKVDFEHAVTKARFSRTLAQLIDLSRSDDAAVASFAGTVTYRAGFNHSAGLSGMAIDLGNVYGVSEVALNGKPLGVRWWGRHLYPADGVLRKGENQLEIRVTTTLANYCKSISGVNPVAYRWAYWFPPIPTGLVGPVSVVAAGE